jgi:hypothetical protein
MKAPKYQSKRDKSHLSKFQKKITSFIFKLHLPIDEMVDCHRSIIANLNKTQTRPPVIYENMHRYHSLVPTGRIHDPAALFLLDTSLNTLLSHPSPLFPFFQKHYRPTYQPMILC